MLVVMGLDLSWTSTGVVRASSQGFNSYVVKTNPKDWYQRLIEIRDTILNLADQCRPHLILVEGYAMGRKFGREQAGELSGVVRLALREAGHFHIHSVPPSVLKKFATGNGQADKTEIAKAALRKWGVDFKTDDETDAFVLARIGLALLGEVEMLAYEKEALAKVNGQVAV